VNQNKANRAPRAPRCFNLFILLLAQGSLILSNNPILAADRKPAASISRRASASDPPGDILGYISAGWDTLTRTMNRCESLEDSKTDGEPALYLPAEMAIPPSITEWQAHCRIRVDQRGVSGIIARFTRCACPFRQELASPFPPRRAKR
jgi:hypothetical protein